MPYLRACSLSAMCALTCVTIKWTHSLGLFRKASVFMFTTWNIALMFIYFHAALAALVIRPRKDHALLRCLHHGALLVALGTHFVFWAVFVYNRELILPRAFVFHPALNHLQHTVPAVALVVECLLFPELLTAPAGERLFDFVCIGVPSLYVIAALAHYRLLRRWPYPFLEGLGPIGASVAALAFICAFWACSRVLRRTPRQTRA